MELFDIAAFALILFWAEIIIFEKKKARLDIKAHISKLKPSIALIILGTCIFQLGELLLLFEFIKDAIIFDSAYLFLIIAAGIHFFMMVIKDV